MTKSRSVFAVLLHLPLVLALMALASRGASASTAYGDLNNFDTVNDTGYECHGFEIEIEGVHSTDITYTYDWNHYGAPRITDDNSDPAHPRVFIRYQSAKNPDGTWAAYTAIPPVPLTPTDGHSCTNPAVNDGCEHFGVGYYGTAAAVRYHWLYDDGSGNLVYSLPVMVATPSWTYAPPAPAQPAVVVAVIPAPVVPIPAAMKFGEPSWVKVIKTTTHNANDIALADLISDDNDEDGNPDWQNAEPAEVETEFKLLQANSAPDDAKDELVGLGDDMGDGSETVTRRYEFYKYAAAADTRDGETGEAMCSDVNPTTDPNSPDYLHGIGNQVAVTDPNGDTYYVDCEAQVVVGDYIGAQMAGFDAAMPLGLVDHLQDGDTSLSYTPRTLVVGGNSPYSTTITQGNLPDGLTIGAYVDPDSGSTAYGVLFGTPASVGDFTFTVEATDADNVTVSKAYTMSVAGAGAPACSDGLDNDGDGLVDYGADPGCASEADASELAPGVACDDGADNDGDGWADYRLVGGDPGCRNAYTRNENPQCQDGLNNDGQPGIDFDGGASRNGGEPLSAPDPQCTAAWTNSEIGKPSACGLGFEIVLLTPLLAALAARRGARPRAARLRVHRRRGRAPG